MTKKRGKWHRLLVEEELRTIPLPSNQRARIKSVLKYKGIGGDVDGFCDDLAFLASVYRVWRELDDQQPTPGEVTAALREFDDSLDSLGQKLTTHGAATKHLLRRHLAADLGDDESIAFLSRVRKDIRTLKRATAQAKQEASANSSSREEHPRSARRVLAEELAASFFHHLDRRPSATDGGPFSECLRIALEHGRATKPETRNFHGLVRYGVSQIKNPEFATRRGIHPNTSNSNTEE